jgi:shikimate dehydrogenase
MTAHYNLGLCGYPLGHSLSPLLHRAALEAAGLSGSYTLFPIPPLPDGQSLLADLIKQLQLGELQGLNVTIPHKQSVIALLDELTPTTRAIGAVNTLFIDNKKIIGDNTDAPGFLLDLAQLPLLEKNTAVVLGAGGAARAVVYALLQSGWQVHIASRRAEQAAALAKELSAAVTDKTIALTSSILEAASLQNYLPGCRLIVNATPAGMSPNILGNPWPAGLDFPRSACLYDLVYNPAETALLRAAHAAGIPARSGLGMLVEQAALAFERWTGCPASRSAMWSSVSAANLSEIRSNPL